MNTTQLASILALAFVACVPPQSSQSQSQYGTPTAASGQSGGGTCESACARAIECGLVEDDGTCPDACRREAYDADTLAKASNGTCEQLAEAAQQHANRRGGATAAASPASGGGGGGGGGGSHLCTAQGTYTRCARGCGDDQASATGVANNVADARSLAVAKCNSQMQNAVLLSPSGDGSVTRACAIASCN